MFSSPKVWNNWFTKVFPAIVFCYIHDIFGGHDGGNWAELTSKLVTFSLVLKEVVNFALRW